MSLPVYTPPPRLGRREQFAAWRRSRPFWGGFWLIVSGVYLWSLTAAPIGVVVIQGVAGASSIIICLVFVLLAVATWAQPQLRVVTGGIAIVLGLAAILLTNLGGFLVGTLLALHGGASMIAWKPIVKRWTRPEAATPPEGTALPVSTGAVGALVSRMSDGTGDDADRAAASPYGPASDVVTTDLSTDPTTAPATARTTDDEAADDEDDVDDGYYDEDDTDVAATDGPGGTGGSTDGAPAADAAAPPSGQAAPRPPLTPPGGMTAGITILPSTSPATPPAAPPASPPAGGGPAPQASATYSSAIR